MFTRLPSGLYKCNICPRLRRAALSRDAAIRHENEDAHVHALRDLDVCDPPSSPVLHGALDDGLPPLYSPMRPAHDEFLGLDPDDWPATTGPARPVHGPALASDHSEQLYNNWSNALGAQFQELSAGGIMPAMASPRQSEHDFTLHHSPVNAAAADYTSFEPDEVEEELLAEGQGEYLSVTAKRCLTYSEYEPNPLSVDDDDAEDWFPWTSREVSGTLMG